MVTSNTRGWRSEDWNTKSFSLEKLLKSPDQGDVMMLGWEKLRDLSRQLIKDQAFEVRKIQADFGRVLCQRLKQGGVHLMRVEFLTGSCLLHDSFVEMQESEY